VPTEQAFMSSTCHRLCCGCKSLLLIINGDGSKKWLLVNPGKNTQFLSLLQFWSSISSYQIWHRESLISDTTTHTFDPLWINFIKINCEHPYGLGSKNKTPVFRDAIPVLKLNSG